MGRGNNNLLYGRNQLKIHSRLQLNDKRLLLTSKATYSLALEEVIDCLTNDPQAQPIDYIKTLESIHGWPYDKKK